MNRMPLRWSTSCCRHVESRPLASISCSFSFEIEISHLDLRRAFHVAVGFRNRKAALLIDRLFIGGPHDLRIDEDLRVLRLLLLGEVHGDHALAVPIWMAASPMPGASYMVSNMSSTSLRIPRIDLFDRLGDFAEPLVRQDQDFAHGHGGDVSGRVPTGST